MSDDNRGLGRGLEDLMAQNEIDLPFLSTYGPASDVEDEISQAKTPQKKSLMQYCGIFSLCDKTFVKIKREKFRFLG